MRSVKKELLKLDEEIYRHLITMLKKLKMSKKEDRMVIAEAVADLYTAFRIFPHVPAKYSVMLNNEEIAKIIWYRTPDALILHDLYVTPKYRKQEVAKILIVEVLSDNRDLQIVEFFARESNKPIHNLTAFFVRKFEIPNEQVSATLTSPFYVDGGKAIRYSIRNPAHDKAQEMEEEPIEEVVEEVDEHPASAAE